IVYSTLLNYSLSERCQRLPRKSFEPFVEVEGGLKRKLITQLQPDTEYSFVLMSRGNGAGAIQQQVSIRTAPDLLNFKPATFKNKTGSFLAGGSMWWSSQILQVPYKKNLKTWTCIGSVFLS
uniref:Fibronectin type-III domain-containing protein n=1 Tax=Oryzias sinensis TaxID=183150 RepID=A0A8C7XCP4_9TELE